MLLNSFWCGLNSIGGNMKSLLTLLVVVLLSGCATAKGMRTDISDGLEKVSEMIRPDAQPVRKPNER